MKAKRNLGVILIVLGTCGFGAGLYFLHPALVIILAALLLFIFGLGIYGQGLKD